MSDPDEELMSFQADLAWEKSEENARERSAEDRLWRDSQPEESNDDEPERN